jgi:folate-dependent phosphoribosylglycinamide formyltransferase PurN
MNAPLDRPIRIVFFGGRYLQPVEARFAATLDEHPEIELVLGVCEGEGFGLGQRLRDLWRRRRWLAPAIVVADALAVCVRFVMHPSSTLSWRRRTSRTLRKFVSVTDVHAPDVLARVRAAAPDLGVIYGAPVLKPALFEIPMLGTLGIHHGRVPQYRGKKTTFWEIYHGERVAGVTIQRVERGIDTGAVVRAGEVEIDRKGYSRVWDEVQVLGCELYLQAILDYRHGRASPTPQDAAAPRAPLFRQPAAKDLIRYWRRRWIRPSSRANGA